MELCYVTNNYSLFRKYAFLLTSLTKHQLFRDYIGLREKVNLLLPNGYHVAKDKKTFRALFFSRPVYAKKFYPALYNIDRLQMFFKNIQEAQETIAFELGLRRQMPDVVKAFYFNTLTKNPDADVETTTVDGMISNNVAQNTWTVVHDAANGTNAYPSIANTNIWNIVAGDTSDRWTRIQRSAFLFDTSSLTIGAILKSATFQVYTTENQDLFSQNVRLVTSTPASNTDLVTDDFDQFGTVAQASDVDVGTLTNNANHTWTLNATGLGNISKSGVTKFGLRSSADADNSAPTWALGTNAYTIGNFADSASNKPQLEITYTPTGGAFLYNFV